MSQYFGTMLFKGWMLSTWKNSRATNEDVKQAAFLENSWKA